MIIFNLFIPNDGKPQSKINIIALNRLKPLQI